LLNKEQEDEESANGGTDDAPVVAGQAMKNRSWYQNVFLFI
jgi:hypothetical protein